MSVSSPIKSHRVAQAAMLLACCLLAGCGTIKGQTATEQLLVSDAVDRTLSQIDFRQLSGSKVYLETKYLRPVNSVGFVNADYIVGSLRELMFRDHCLLQERAQDADYVVEIRVGALGTDNHEVNYGIPGNTVLNQTAGLLTSSPLMPAIPEVSFAKRSERRAAAKIAVFAYRRETQEPVWETGTIHGLSSAKSTWVLGAGPFQKGEIYEDSHLAAAPLDFQTFENQKFSPLRPLAAMLGRKPDVVARYNKSDRFSPEAIESERLLAQNTHAPQAPAIAVPDPTAPPQPEAELVSSNVPVESEPSATPAPAEPPPKLELASSNTPVLSEPSAETPLPATQPDATRQFATQPAVAQPAATQQAATQPAVVQPAATQPAATQQAVTPQVAAQQAVTPQVAAHPQPPLSSPLPVKTEPGQATPSNFVR